MKAIFAIPTAEFEQVLRCILMPTPVILSVTKNLRTKQDAPFGDDKLYPHSGFFVSLCSAQNDKKGRFDQKDRGGRSVQNDEGRRFVRRDKSECFARNDPSFCHPEAKPKDLGSVEVSSIVQNSGERRLKYG
jgi:hypothetical protein